MFLGIDLTSSEAKASACAALDKDGSLLRLASPKTDADILALAAEWQPSIVAIDAPLGFPKGMCCLEESCDCESVWLRKGRICEQELVRRGIPLYFTTKKCIIKQMMYRAIGLADIMASRGIEVLKVYPYASKVCLFGKPIPKKTTKEGLDFLHERLSRLIPGLTSYPGHLDHDSYDALVAAYTAYLHHLGRTEAAGLQEEVCIVTPSVA